MARYNQKSMRPAVKHVMTSSAKADSSTKTHGGADGYTREAKSELFIRATSSFAGQKSFYESADQRDMRLVELTHELAVTDEGWVWLSGFLPWLRGEGNMRTAPILIASEAVKARLNAKLPSPQWGGAPSHRALLDSVMQRPDEPGEMLAYWLAVHGRAVPKPVKRALADAARRLYNEKSLLKYDGDSRGVRFADVLELTHPSPATDKPWQGDLFKYAIDRRHNRDDIVIPDNLRMLKARNGLMETPVDQRRDVLLRHPEALENAGMTWESLAGWLQGPMDAEAWQAIIPSMGYMALIRNLRNFDEAGIDNKVARGLAARIADPEQVAKSKQFPFRFYSAYTNAPSLRWGQALEEAMDYSLNNVPELGGRTLVLIDTSGSMQTPVSQKSTMLASMQAAIFGLALKLKNPTGVDVYGFADGCFSVTPDKGVALLTLANEFQKLIGSVGYGTQMDEAIRVTFKGHDRVVILTDMQAFRPGMWGRGHEVGSFVPKNVPIYAWNLVGYNNSALPSGGNSNRYDLAGMTDSSFKLMQMLEAGKASVWPWEMSE